MSFNLDDFERVELPYQKKNFEVTFNRDGKITFNKDLSSCFINSNGELVLLHLRASSASIYKQNVDGKTKQIFISMNQDTDQEGCCSVSILPSQQKVRINTKGCIDLIEGVKVKGKKWGGDAVSYIHTEDAERTEVWGVLVDVSRRAKSTTKKKSTKKETELSSPAGEQATPKTQQKSTKIVESPTGALQMK